MAEEPSANHPHAILLRSAYAKFLAGDARTAVDELAAVLEHDPAAREPGRLTGMLWGLTGDCYFKLGEGEKGFAAYRQSLQLDPSAGCLALFARQVADEGRWEDAALALRCLDLARDEDWRAFRRHPIHFLSHNLSPSTIYFRLVRWPRIRRRLRQLAAERDGSA